MSRDPDPPATSSVLYVTGDEAKAVAFQREMPARAGVEVITAQTVDEGLQLFYTEPRIEAVVSDHDLPDIDGVAFLETVRASAPIFPFVLFATAGDEEVASRAIHAHVSDYLIEEEFRDQWDHLATLVEGAIEYYHSRRSLTNERENRDAVLDSALDGLLVVQDEEVIYANDRSAQLVGIADSDDLLGRSLEQAMFAGEWPFETKTLAALRNGDRHVATAVTECEVVGGSTIPAELTATAIRWDGEPAILFICRDVSDREERQFRLRRFERAVEAAGHAVYMTDAEGTIEYVNPAFEEITGYHSSEAIGANPRILNSSQMSDDYYEQLWATVRAGEVWEQEVLNQRKSGMEYYVSQTIAPIPGEDGESLAFVAIQRDVTEEYEQREAIRQLSDDQGVVSGVNQALVRAEDAAKMAREVTDIIAESGRFECATIALTGEGASDALYENGSELAGVDETWVESYAERVSEAEGVHIDDPSTLPVGKNRAGRSAQGVALSHAGTDYGVLTVVLADESRAGTGAGDLLTGLADDIAFFLHSRQLDRERARREREAHEQRQRYEALFASIRDAILVTDTDARIVDSNPAFAALFGYDPEDIEGESAQLIFHTGEEYEDLLETVRGRSGQFRYSQTVEFEKKSGQVFPGETDLFAFIDADGESVGYVALVRDISDREARIRQIEVLDRVLRHNLTNKMQVIEGAAEMIRQAPSESATEHADKIIETGDDLLESIEKERLITRYLRDPTEPRQVSLVTLVRRAVGEASAEYPRADLRVDLPDSATATATAAAGQAIDELIENAIVHSDEETPRVTVTVENLDETVCVSVADDGPGIPRMERDVLTQRGELDPLYHGSGLGLWQVNLIVTQADGRLEFAENEPRGSIVRLHFPPASE